MKEEKDIARMNFAEYLRKSGVSENRKVYWTERHCYISKRRWDMCNILKSPLATAREMKVEMDDQSFLQEEPLLRHCFIKGAVFFFATISYYFLSSRFKQVNTFSACFVLVRIAANCRHAICKRNRWKIPEHIVKDVYIFMLLYLECT